jgi:predicted dienelactone hydrolase
VKRRIALLAGLALGIVAVPACSSGDDAPPTAKGGDDTTTTAGRTSSPIYAKAGPYQVGSITIALDDGRRVVVWYPAAGSAADTPTEIFDIASLLNPDMQAKIPAELRPKYEIDAHVGADAAKGGPFPVVLFSHGYAGFPEQSADLVTHLAGWGFVVIAPDHVERSLSGLLGTAAQGKEKRSDPDVLSQSLDAAVADADRDGSPLAGVLDVDHVAVAGHSAGAAAAYVEARADPRIDAFISYSVGFDDETGATEMPPAPDLPGMVMLGETDDIIPPAETRKVYEAMSAPKYLVEIADAGHLVFSDICRIGRDQGGLVSLVDQAGLDIPEQFLQLAKDGCEEGDLPPEDAFPAIDHLSVAFLRDVFGLDDAPVGLDPSVTEAFTDADVTLTVDA